MLLCTCDQQQQFIQLETLPRCMQLRWRKAFGPNHSQQMAHISKSKQYLQLISMPDRAIHLAVTSVCVLAKVRS